jgi:RimJ/RimL family protein N-acetyltransferase
MVQSDRQTGGVGPRATFAHKPTLRGSKVLLRPVREEDAHGLATVDTETLGLTGTHHRVPLEAIKQWYATRASCDDRLDLSIVELASGAWAGEVVLHDLQADDRNCRFRILLARRELYDRGLGTEATSLVLAHAFETVGLHRVELEVLADNPRARHVYDKLGFVDEGTRRQSLLWEGAFVDTAVMSMLATEWEARRAPPAR